MIMHQFESSMYYECNTKCLKTMGDQTALALQRYQSPSRRWNLLGKYVNKSFAPAHELELT